MNTNLAYQKPESNEKPQNYGGYGGSLFDPRWRAKRQEVIERDNNRCANCGSVERLQVHHRQYHFSKCITSFRNPWEYSNKYMVTLCENCHQKGHRIYKVPVKYIN
jgi:5-methylcytosine-specific restriction endonuclease McrA